MGSLSPDPLKPSLRSATVKSQEMQLLGAEGIIQSVQKRMEDVSLYLYQGLEDVYSKEDRQMLENIRTVLNLERILQLTGDMSPAVVTQREVSKFLEAWEYIDQDFDVKYEKSELRTQYRDFVEQISVIGKQENSKNLSSLQIMVIMMNTNDKAKAISAELLV